MPAEVAFATKPRPGQAMLARAFAAGLAVPVGDGRQRLWRRPRAAPLHRGQRPRSCPGGDQHTAARRNDGHMTAPRRAGKGRPRHPANAAGPFRNGRSDPRDTVRPGPCSGRTPRGSRRGNPQRSPRADGIGRHAPTGASAECGSHRQASRAGSGSRSKTRSSIVVAERIRRVRLHRPENRPPDRVSCTSIIILPEISLPCFSRSPEDTALSGLIGPARHRGRPARRMLRRHVYRTSALKLSREMNVAAIDRYFLLQIPGRAAQIPPKGSCG